MSERRVPLPVSSNSDYEDYESRYQQPASCVHSDDVGGRGHLLEQTQQVSHPELTVCSLVGCEVVRTPQVVYEECAPQPIDSSMEFGSCQ